MARKIAGFPEIDGELPMDRRLRLWAWQAEQKKTKPKLAGKKNLYHILTQEEASQKIDRIYRRLNILETRLRLVSKRIKRILYLESPEKY